MSRYIDVSMPIENGMLVWPTDPAVEVTSFKSPTKGDRSTVTKLTLGTHSGTHIDAPKHFLPQAEGIETLDELMAARDTGAHFAQGYLLARRFGVPVTPSGVSDRLIRSGQLMFCTARQTCLWWRSSGRNGIWRRS